MIIKKNEEPQDEYKILDINIKIGNHGFYFEILSHFTIYSYGKIGKDSAYQVISLNPFGIIQEYNINKSREDYPIYLKHIEKELKNRRRK